MDTIMLLVLFVVVVGLWPHGVCVRVLLLHLRYLSPPGT